MMKFLLTFFLLFASASAQGNSGNGGGNSDTEYDPAEYAAENAECTVTWHENHQYYKPSSSNNPAHKLKTCYPGALTDDDGTEYYLACQAFDADDGQAATVTYSGTCQRRDCFGLDDADEIDGPLAGENEATERITICHRTCSSEVNPWVRITIDLDAWEKPERCGDPANGHQPHIDATTGVTQGHTIPCSDFPVSHWDLGSDGFLESIQTADGLFGDYEVMRHGTRQDVRDKIESGEITGFTDEKDYWKYWERACPTVRNGVCCGLHGEGCCGYSVYPPDEPEDVQPTDDPTKSPTKSPTESPTKNPTPQPSVGVSNPPTADCPDEPVTAFTKNMYITFMGTEHHNHDNIDELLAEADPNVGPGYSIEMLEDTIVNEYNKLSANGICEKYGKKFLSVTFDTSSSTHAVNKNYELVGIRMKAVVEGLCTGCEDELLFPAELCDESTPSYCPACIERDGSTPAAIVSVSGMDLLTAVNEFYGWTETGAEIFRIQGDIDGETTCSTGYKYILANGDIKCIG